VAFFFFGDVDLAAVFFTGAFLGEGFFGEGFFGEDFFTAAAVLFLVLAVVFFLVAFFFFAIVLPISSLRLIEEVNGNVILAHDPQTKL
jgi:hypothetical protein